eukprot:866472-Prorocentrum_minimum.AAC.1
MACSREGVARCGGGPRELRQAAHGAGHHELVRVHERLLHAWQQECLQRQAAHEQPHARDVLEEGGAQVPVAVVQARDQLQRTVTQSHSHTVTQTHSHRH